MNSFKNRKSEMGILQKSCLAKAPKLIVMYGRRRVGKTALIQEFLKRNNGIYLLARQETEKENLRRFSIEISGFFNDPVPEASPFQNWDSLFLYLNKKLEEKRFAIAIDEFPYLVSANKSVPSILQDYWDNKLSKSNAFIILCGSSISMMEKILGYKSPIYGRRTEQMLIEPLGFYEALEFMPKSMDEKTKAIYYSILGGTPAYLSEFDYSISIEKNLMENYLQKTKFLYQDALFVLREELSEPRNYFAILRAISKGKVSLNEIVNETGLNRGVVSKYLSVLIDIHLVERAAPITEKKSSRRGVYKIKDAFFRFWFRFVHENEEYIEQNKQELLLKEKILPNLNSYVGGVFEDIALRLISQRPEFKEFIFGRWWHKDTEIDIVGKSSSRLVFIEAKWKNISKNEASSILENLRLKAEKFPNQNKGALFGMIAKKIEAKESLRKAGYVILDLGDLTDGLK